MAFKTAIATLALGTLFFGSTAAQAADGSVRDWASQQSRRDDRRDNHRDYYEAHVHTRDCHHAPAPRPPPRAQGRYELQTVNRWVEGRYERVWVPEVCTEQRRGRHGRVTRCTEGHFEQRWVPGRYERATEWVWVSYERNDWRPGYHTASYHP
ncbi:hypothetical protein LY474_24280 [Myxococcus stipitatus]|uniref:hypothetical protein n=1 Tax=Myxococcus stipitatus TaxID=83455 RepID=UPI001F214457|nr:hypothetical protein [Myxococcus stipitatus]MCE9670931.1 hypothetical protein [Myxococcus stipitatus]